MLLAPRTRGDLVTDRLYDLRREMDRMFDRVWGESRQANGGGTWMPPVDVVENDEAIWCSVEIPGIEPEHLDVTVEDHVLTVSGERRRDHEQREGEHRLYERRYGRFERSFSLPQTVDADNVKARYENGVLEIMLPKTEEARPRRVPIEEGTGGRRIEAS